MSQVGINYLGWTATAVFVGSYFFTRPSLLRGAADAWGAAVADLWRADQGIAGHCCQCAGVFRGCMDHVSQGLNLALKPL